MHRHLRMSARKTSTIRYGGKGSQANQSGCSAVGFAAVYVAGSKGEVFIVAWAMEHRDSAARLWPLLMMQAPTSEAKAREAEADPVRATAVARSQEAAMDPSRHAESAAPMNSSPHDAPKEGRRHMRITGSPPTFHTTESGRAEGGRTWHWLLDSGEEPAGQSPGPLTALLQQLGWSSDHSMALTTEEQEQPRTVAHISHEDPWQKGHILGERGPVFAGAVWYSRPQRPC